MRYKTANTARVSIQDRRLRADVLFIRTQSAIRADGPPSEQAWTLKCDLPGCICAFSSIDHCAFARANRVFCTDEKHIRTENTVKDKNKYGLGFLVRATSRACLQGTG